MPNKRGTTAGAVALGYMTYVLIAKDKAWLGARPGEESATN
ncbi:MAG TPA: hypothetical protein VGM39_06835 [Kofleriaceae bacterium]|jgi:hypothetical protein